MRTGVKLCLSFTKHEQIISIYHTHYTKMADSTNFVQPISIVFPPKMMFLKFPADTQLLKTTLVPMILLDMNALIA